MEETIQNKNLRDFREMKEKLDFLKNVAIKYKCYNKPYDLWK